MFLKGGCEVCVNCFSAAVNVDGVGRRRGLVQFH